MASDAPLKPPLFVFIPIPYITIQDSRQNTGLKPAKPITAYGRDKGGGERGAATKKWFFSFFLYDKGSPWAVGDNRFLKMSQNSLFFLILSNNFRINNCVTAL